MAKPPRRTSWTKFVAAHRARAPQRRADATKDRVLVFAIEDSVRRWIDHELFAENVTIQFVDSLADMVAGLTLAVPPRPQLLVVDATAIAPSDLDAIAAIRNGGWSGMVIAIGDVSSTLHRALGVDRMLPRTLASEALRTAIRTVGAERATTRMKRLDT